MHDPIRQILPALKRMDGHLFRILGSTDVRGQGTPFPVPHLGPFVLAEDARGIGGPNQPPFGLHPHAGLVAISYFAEGQTWRSLSDVPGAERLTMDAGDVLVTAAGSGLRHDEHTVADGDHHVTQIILRLPEDHRAIDPFIRKHAPKRLGGGVRRLFDAQALAGTGIAAEGFHVVLPAGGTAEVPMAPGHIGWVYVRRGAVRIGTTPLGPDEVGVLDPGEVLSLVTDPGCDVLIGTGLPIDEPWEKLLGHSGFVVARDEAACAAILARYD